MICFVWLFELLFILYYVLLILLAIMSWSVILKKLLSSRHSDIINFSLRYSILMILIQTSTTLSWLHTSSQVCHGWQQRGTIGGTVRAIGGACVKNMFGSFESIFYHWRAAFYGSKMSRWSKSYSALEVSRRTSLL